MAEASPPVAPATALAPHQAAALQRALRYIDAHLSQPLRVTELAEVACVSRFHLVRLFRTGQYLAGDAALHIPAVLPSSVVPPTTGTHP